MITISFTLPEKYESKKSQVNSLINLLKGDYRSISTKDGYAYSVDFESTENSKEFEKKLANIIPDIHEY